MILILDEQLDSEDRLVSKALNVLTIPKYECEFRSMREDTSRGMADEDIPEYCREQNVDMLVSLNVRDFAAKMELFRRLLVAGVSVAVLRTTKRSLTAERQLAILAVHTKRLVLRLQQAQGPILIILTETEMKERSLDQLVTEIQTRTTRRLP